jgi:hypothetical protein
MLLASVPVERCASVRAVPSLVQAVLCVARPVPRLTAKLAVSRLKAVKAVVPTSRLLQAQRPMRPVLAAALRLMQALVQLAAVPCFLPVVLGSSKVAPFL